MRTLPPRPVAKTRGVSKRHNNAFEAIAKIKIDCMNRKRYETAVGAALVAMNSNGIVDVSNNEPFDLDDVEDIVDCILHTSLDFLTIHGTDSHHDTWICFPRGKLGVAALQDLISECTVASKTDHVRLVIVDAVHRFTRFAQSVIAELMDDSGIRNLQIVQTSLNGTEECMLEAMHLILA